MSETPFDKVLDASGLNCPMPVVKARREVRSLEPGQVLKVISTDRGSVKDFQGWAKVDKKVDLVGQESEPPEDPVTYIHYVQLAK